MVFKKNLFININWIWFCFEYLNYKFRKGEKDNENGGERCG